MGKRGARLAACLILFSAVPPEAWTQAPSGGSRGEVQFALILGVTDNRPTRWKGSIEAQGARITKLALRRPIPADVLGDSDWDIRTVRVNLANSRTVNRRRFPVLPRVIFVTAELLDAAPSFTVRTRQGNFSFELSQLAWGRTLRLLNGRAQVTLTPAPRLLTSSIEEEDFPALARHGDTIYLAYVKFTHGDRSQVWPRQLTEKPASYDPLARPVGGDQVFFREYSLATGEWSEPEPVSKAGQDVYKTAVAVDGNGRVWVIWSARVGGYFDLYARRREGGAWSDVIRLTQTPGPDLSPVAATDTRGAVWVAWQAFVDGDFDILIARQEGDRFGEPFQVSPSLANDWAPQIAAGPGGEMAVVWDTYDKGDYDVYLRRFNFAGTIIADKPLPVAASRKFEARPSVVYTPPARIWVAYEESYRRWGKDFGAYETTGTGLYQGMEVRVKVIEGRRFYHTQAALDPVIAIWPAPHPVHYGRLRGNPRIPSTEQPNPELALNRLPGTTPYPRNYPSKSFVRLTASRDGTVFLAYRNVVGSVRGPVGTTWFENLVFFDGETWTGPVFLPHSDAVLDNRPAMLGLDDGKVFIVGSTDHRFNQSGLITSGGQDTRINYDLVAWELDTAWLEHVSRAGYRFGKNAPARRRHTPSTAALAPLPEEIPSSPEPDTDLERSQVDRMRTYRVRLDTPEGAREFRLLRGEFHRHTEISGDGRNDGAIIDAWRYLIDAASMDWAGCCDHDNGGGREYTWWLTQKMTDAFLLPGRFTPMFSYERSVRYPEGHRNVIFARRGIRPLPRLPKTEEDSPPEPAPDTQMLYEYLRYFDGIAAVHTSATRMGTDWRDNDPEVEPVVEIYQGDRQNYEMPGAPRSNSEGDSIGGWRPLGFVNLALEKGYRLGFQASSDHISTHMSYCNLWVEEPTRDAILEAFKKRRIYGATENILADVRSSGHFMGEEFTLEGQPVIEVKLWGTAPFAKVHIIKDGAYVYTTEPGTAEVNFTWRDAAAEPGKVSYYYVRGEQADGEIVWVSPMWIHLQ